MAGICLDPTTIVSIEIHPVSFEVTVSIYKVVVSRGNTLMTESLLEINPGGTERQL